MAAPASAAAAESWRAVTAHAGDAACLLGADPRRVALFACAASAEPCATVPWQLDERDAAGEYVLDHGPQASRDDDGGRIDANDEIVLMWSDMASGEGSLPGEPSCVDEIEVEVGEERRRVFAARFAGEAPRSPLRYVDYDVAADRMYGGRVNLTFAAPTPRGLALREGVAAGRNLLDRLKIRARARFFGIVPLERDEDDIESVYEAWRVGPIRILRRERKWVELAFGFRTPYMRTETTFYRDFALLPVRMRLNFPPAKLLSGIELRANLDFIDLGGWRLWVPDLAAVLEEGADPLEVGKVAPATARRLAALTAPLIALEGTEATFALALRLGPSLQSLSKTVFYSEDASLDAPEAVPGSLPAIGFRLTDWKEVAAGPHWFVAESYALPAGAGAAAFAADLGLPVAVSIRRRDDLAGAPAPHLTGPPPIH